MRKSVIWFVVNTSDGYNYLLETIKEQKCNIAYYKSSFGFNLYCRVEGLDRKFAYDKFNHCSIMDSLDEIYFIKNSPSSSISLLDKESFLSRLASNEKIHRKVQVDFVS